MHLRRALLLFALVLGFAAIAASLAPPPPEDDSGGRTATDGAPTPPRPPSGEPPPAVGSPTELRFVTGADRPERHTISVGEHTLVTVAVQAPGQVAIEGLGLLGFAEPGTPARFDVLPSRAGRYEVTFRGIEEEEAERVGIIEVEPA